MIKPHLKLPILLRSLAFSDWNNLFLFALLLYELLLLYLLTIVNGFRDFNVSVLLQLLLSRSLYEFVVLLVNLFGFQVCLLSIHTLVAVWFAVNLLMLALLSSFFDLLFSLQWLSSLAWSLGLEYRLDLILEVLEKALIIKNIQVFGIVSLNDSLVGFGSLGEFYLSLRRWIIFRMVFDCLFSVCLLNLFHRCIFGNLQNLVW